MNGLNTIANLSKVTKYGNDSTKNVDGRKYSLEGYALMLWKILKLLQHCHFRSA
jgi:hypothetical protein